MSNISNTREVIITSDSTGENHSALVYDPRTGSLLSTYKANSALAPRTLQICNAAYVIAADATKPRIHVWPINSPNPVPNLRLKTPGRVNALACTPSGSYIVAGVGEKLFIWQVCNGRLLTTLTHHYQPINCLSFNKDGSTLASGAEDGLVFVWSFFQVLNNERPAPLHGFSNHSLPVKDLVFGFAGSRARLCSVSLDRTCNLYEPSSGSLLLTLVFDVPLTAVSISARESDLFVGCIDGNIHRFNLHEPPRGVGLNVEHHVEVKSDGLESDSVFKGHTGSVVCLSVSIDCRYLLSGSSTGAVNIFDIASRQILRTIDHKGSITSAFFAKEYENFTTVKLEPRIEMCPLQRISDENPKDSFVRVNNRGTNIDLPEIDEFLGVEGRNGDVDGFKKLLECREEINRLKRINAEIYKFSVESILKPKVLEKSKIIE